jgi:hypothetical protein
VPVFRLDLEEDISPRSADGNLPDGVGVLVNIPGRELEFVVEEVDQRDLKMFQSDSECVQLLRKSQSKGRACAGPPGQGKATGAELFGLHLAGQGVSNVVILVGDCSLPIG